MHYSPGVNSSPCRPPGESIRRIKKAISHTALGLSPHKKCVLMHVCVYVFLCKGVCLWKCAHARVCPCLSPCIINICVCVCVCVCLCVCKRSAYIHMYTESHTHTQLCELAQ